MVVEELVNGVGKQKERFSFLECMNAMGSSLHSLFLTEVEKNYYHSYLLELKQEVSIILMIGMHMLLSLCEGITL